MNKRCHTRNEDIEEALVTLARSGGKLLRPAFFFFLLNWVMKKNNEKQQLIKNNAASLEILTYGYVEFTMTLLTILHCAEAL